MDKYCTKVLKSDIVISSNKSMDSILNGNNINAH